MSGKADTIPDKFLVCRIDRHSYDRRKSTVEMEGGVYVWTRKCGVCGVRRVQRLRANGTIIGNRYLYPQGYQVKGGGQLDRLRLAEIRLQVVLNGLA